MAEGLSSRNLAILRGSALALPIADQRREFGRLLESTYAEFFRHLEGLDGPLQNLIGAREARIRLLATSIVTAWRRVSDEDVAGGFASLDAGIGAVRDELAAISRRQAAILPDQCWYRLAAWPGVNLRAHVFHPPFERSQSSYRFSTPGAPSLYLANSVYLCWLECGRPRFDRCFVSRFEIDLAGFELLNLPAGSEAYISPLDIPEIPGVHFDPRRVMNSPYVDDVTSELAEYLTVWPLLAAITVSKRRRADGWQPAYVIPQLLMLWVSTSDRFLGIRYFTSKPERSGNSNDWPINLALPTRTRKPSGYCDFLKSRARCTTPQPLAEMSRHSPHDLATEWAVEERERRSGKYMLKRGRSIELYFSTPFGKMEYWLDRPDFELATI